MVAGLAIVGWIRCSSSMPSCSPLSATLAALLLFAHAAAAPQPSPSGGNRIVARAGMEVVTFADLRDLARLKRLQGASDAELAGVVDEAINRSLILSTWPDGRPLPDDLEGRKSRFTEDYINDMRHSLGGQENFAEALRLLEWSETELRRYVETRYEENYKIRQMVYRKFEPASDEQVREFERELEEEGRPLALYQISLIFLSYGEAENPEPYSRAALDASERALQALVRIDAGEPFAVVAREVSDDAGTSALGGIVGEFRESDLRPEFREVAAALAVGEVSMPVETPEGVYLIRLERKRTAEDELQGRRFRSAYASLVEELRQKNPVEIVDPELRRYYEEERELNEARRTAQSANDSPSGSSAP